MHLNRPCAQFGPNVPNFRICSESAVQEQSRCNRAPEFSARSHWSSAVRLALAPPVRPLWAERAKRPSLPCKSGAGATVLPSFQHVPTGVRPSGLHLHRPGTAPGRPGPTWAGRSNLSSIRVRCRDRSCATVFSTFPLDCSAPAPHRHRTRPNVANKPPRYVWTKKDMFTQRWPTRLHTHSHPTHHRHHNTINHTMMM